MEIGEFKFSQMIAAGIVILLLSLLGYWVYETTKQPVKKQHSLVQQEEVPEQQEDIQPSFEPIFQPLGVSSVAMKLPATALLQKDSIVETPAEYRAFIVGDNGAVFSVSVTTLATQDQETFKALQAAYQQGEALDGYEKQEMNHRIYYYQQKEVQLRTQESYYTFFGDHYVLEVSHLNESNAEVPSASFSEFMQEVSFTSKYFTRNALKQIFIKLFAEKNLLDHSSVGIEQLWATENHARGEVTLTTTAGTEAGLFFGVKDENEWVLVFEGNGSFKCSVLEFHAFPEPMQEGCR